MLSNSSCILFDNGTVCTAQQSSEVDFRWSYGGASEPLKDLSSAFP